MKDGDPRVRALGELAREEAGDVLADPRWEALAAGTISAEDLAALHALAARSPEAAEALRVLAPLDQGVEDRIVAAARAALPRDEKKGERAAEDAKDTKVVPLAPRRASRWPAIAGGLALAAAVVLGLSLRPASVREGALPAFEPVLTVGVKELRGDAPEPVLLARGAAITAALRPAAPVAGKVAARAWLVRGEEAVGLATSEIEVSADGAVKLTMKRPAGRAVAAGAADLLVLVCRPDALPPEGEARAAKLGAAGDRCRSLRRGVIVEGE